MGRHIRENAVVIGFQIFVARILLGHGAAVTAHGIGLVVQCGSGAAKAHGDLPYDELGGGIAGVGVLARLQAYTVRIPVGQCKPEKILLVFGQLRILIAVVLVFGRGILRIVGQRNTALDAEAVDIVPTVFPIGFGAGQPLALGGVVMHFAEIRAEALAEIDVVRGLQSVGGGEGVSFLVGQRIVPAYMTVGEIHRHAACRRRGQRQHGGEQHDGSKKHRHPALTFFEHENSSVRFFE